MTGKELKRIRRRLRLTQVEMAHLLGVSPISVSRWELDAVPIRAPMVKLIGLLAKQKKGGK